MKTHCILVVDDSAVIRKQMRTMLSSMGYEVIEAENGKAALEKTGDANNKIDLIFTDINMPEMDGLTFLENLHKTEVKLPVVMMTTESATSLVEKAKEFGAKGWIVKPVTQDILKAIIAKVDAKRVA